MMHAPKVVSLKPLANRNSPHALWNGDVLNPDVVRVLEFVTGSGHREPRFPRDL
jgi:hypothetical protein